MNLIHLDTFAMFSSKGEYPEKQVPFRYELIVFFRYLNELGLLGMDERDLSNKLKLADRQDLMAIEGKGWKLLVRNVNGQKKR